jgi:hypothetical protein
MRAIGLAEPGDENYILIPPLKVGFFIYVNIYNEM